MTAQILHLRDYKLDDDVLSAEVVESLKQKWRDMPLGFIRIGPPLTYGLPSDFPIQYRREDTSPSEYCGDSGDCA